MISYFLDSSAIVKVYASEMGSDVARALFYGPGHRLYVSWLSLTEVPSALYRKSGIPRSQTDVLLIRFMTDYEQRCDEIRLSDHHALLALDLIKQHALTSADALILAQTLRLAQRIRRLILVASDEKMLAAARRENLPTTDPTQLKYLP